MSNSTLFSSFLQNQPDLKGQVFLVTGGTSGIGREVVRGLAFLNATVIFTGRSEEAGKDLTTDIKLYLRKTDIEYIYCNHANMKSVIKLAEKIKNRYESINCLINNVGCFEGHIKTEEGYNYMLACNYFSHFVLTDQLYILLRRAQPNSRVIEVTSDYIKGIEEYDFKDMNYLEKSFNIRKAYKETKLYCHLFVNAQENITKMKGDEDTIKAISFNPGHTDTNLYKYSGTRNCCMYCIKKILCMIKSPEASAEALLYCAILPWQELKFGGLYEDFKQSKASKFSEDRNNGQKLWDNTISFQEPHIELQNLSKTYNLIPHKIINSNQFIGKNIERISCKSKFEKEGVMRDKCESSIGGSSKNENYYNFEKMKINIYGALKDGVEVKSNPEIPEKSLDMSRDSKRGLKESQDKNLRTSEERPQTSEERPHTSGVKIDKSILSRDFIEKSYEIEQSKEENNKKIGLHQNSSVKEPILILGRQKRPSIRINFNVVMPES